MTTLNSIAMIVVIAQISTECSKSLYYLIGLNMNMFLCTNLLYITYRKSCIMKKMK